MSEFFHIHLLPAGYGDCLWIEYGDDDAETGSRHRILIDGGLGGTHDTLVPLLEALPDEQRNFELLVCTHYDLDHISGLLRLFRKPPAGLKIGDVWFNGWHQIKDLVPGLLGAKQAEDLGALIELHGLRHNHAFGGDAVMDAGGGAFATHDLPGGMKVTVIGPPKDRLVDLRKDWEETVAHPGEEGRIGKTNDEVMGLLGEIEDVQQLAEAPFKEDRSVPNGSSIVLLLEWAGRRALVTGDAFPSDVLAALQRWNAVTGSPLASVDAFKLSHHGGKPNTSPELLQYVAATHYLISTNGVSYNHPDPETIARLLVHGPRDTPRHLHFNYRTEHNQRWDNALLQSTHGYEAHYPADDEAGIRVVV